MKKNNQVNILRHSLAHILASAVKKLYPKVKFGTGPATENGFYYDFDLPEKISDENLPKIEKEMKKIIAKNIEFKKEILPKEKAKKLFKEQPYKLELIDSVEEKEVSVYKSGDFIDLCKGPHIKSTREIKDGCFKLTKVAGAYWKGDEKNKMLTRIYGIAFLTKKELQDHLEKIKEAEKRDHRVLGKKLELFIFDEEVGKGLPIWLPKGEILRSIIMNYLREELNSQDYKWISSPHIGKITLWKKSGHWNFYRENIYSPIKIDEEQYLLKPMSCPFHIKAYQSKIRSYKDLPLKFAEFGTVYRYEKSGVLHGLTRVRGFTQDDAHIFCTPEQLPQELTSLLKHGLKILKTFGFENYKIYLSTRPEKYMGDDKMWKKATNSLKYAFKKLNVKYSIDPGGGVFYGPKIDIKILDSIGREWQCGTYQIDFNLPKAFDIVYIDEKGKKREPIMIHRALLGSLERFIGVLLENYAGALPLWLSPVQINILPVGKRHRPFAKKVFEKLTENGFRCELKDENETISKKIRDGEIQRIPYLLVVGDKEVKKNSVRVRKREKGDIGMMTLEKFLEKIKKEREKKK